MADALLFSGTVVHQITVLQGNGWPMGKPGKLESCTGVSNHLRAKKHVT